MSPATVILTGGAHGIGRATAAALVARGHRVGMIDRDAEGLADIGRGHPVDGGGDVSCEAADVTDRDALAAAVDRLESIIGPTDGARCVRGDRRPDAGAGPGHEGAAGDAGGQRRRRGPRDRGGPAGDDRPEIRAHRRRVERGGVSGIAVDGVVLGVEGGAVGLPRSVAAGLEAAGGDDHDRLPRVRPHRLDRDHALPQPRADDGAGAGRGLPGQGRGAEAEELRLPSLHVSGHGLPPPRPRPSRSTG